MIHFSAAASCLGLLAVFWPGGAFAAAGGVPPLIQSVQSLADDNNYHSLETGVPFTIQCTVGAGDPPPEITWFKDEVVISEGAIAGLRFTKPRALSDSSRGGKDLFFEEPDTASHEGYYHCEANNPSGTAKSQVIFVSEKPKYRPESAVLPEFDTKPSPQLRPYNSDAELTCEASGVPTPDITWTHNANPITGFENSNTLRIDRVNEHSVGTYACNASNEYGYVYKMVQATILRQEPVLVEEPGKRKAAIGQTSLKLRCSAKGYPQPEYEWTFDKESIEDNPNYEVVDGDLVIKKVMNESAGGYKCMARNEEGSVESVGSLKVVSTTTIDVGPKDMMGRIGEALEIPCMVIWDPKNKLTVQWLKNNVEKIDMSGRFSKKSDGADNTLVIEDLEFGDKGTYTCVASTSSGTDTKSGELTVEGIPPKIIVEPSDRIVTEGTRIVLPCTATGVPEPEHVWFNDTERVVYDDERVYLDHEGSLIIERAAKWDTRKKFICRAENEWGNDIKSAWVDVRRATVVLSSPPPYVPLEAGQSGNITFEYEVDPLMEELTDIHCEKDGERLNESDPRYDISKEGLFIANMSAADLGEYECTILTPADRQVLVTSVYDPNATQWWIMILLIALIIVAALLLCGCCVYCFRKHMHQSGRYGVKDIEEGRTKANRSDIQYSINEESDGDEGEYDVNNDLLDGGGGGGKGDNAGGKIEKPIFRGSSKNGGLKNAVYGGGSENSLLEGTDDLIRLTRGMSEDGSFREGRYGDDE